jgi:hypothetical protein
MLKNRRKKPNRKQLPYRGNFYAEDEISFRNKKAFQFDRNGQDNISKERTQTHIGEQITEADALAQKERRHYPGVSGTHEASHALRLNFGHN